MKDPIMTAYWIVCFIAISAALFIHKAYNYRHKYGKNLMDAMRLENQKYEDLKKVDNYEDAVKEVVKREFASYVRKRNIEYKTARKDVIIILVLGVIMTIFYVNNMSRSGVFMFTILAWFLVFLFKKWLWNKLEAEKKEHEANNPNQECYDENWYDKNWYNKEWHDKYGFTKDNAVRSKDWEIKSPRKKLWFYSWLFWGILIAILAIAYVFLILCNN